MKDLILERARDGGWLVSEPGGMIRTFLITTLIASPVAAQEAVCGDRATAVAKLEEKYGETVQSMGIASNGALIEMFANPETGTWTAMMTTPDGRMCLMAAGQAFHAVPPEPEGDPA